MPNMPNMPNKKPKARSRKPLWFIAALSLCTLAISSYALAQRIDTFNKDRDAPLFSFRDIQKDAFLFNNHPFTIKEIPIDDKPHLQINFAQDELHLPVTIPSKQPHPTLFARQTE